MNFLKRVLSRKSTTIAVTPKQIEEMIIGALGGGLATSGVHVTPDRAMQQAAVYACVRVLSESVASLPLVMYHRRRDGGRERATDHPLYTIVHDAPNGMMTAFEWVEMMVAHLALRGNHYNLISRAGDGKVLELLPLHPDRVRPGLTPAGEVVYEYTSEDGKRVLQVYRQDDVLHVPSLSFNGVLGITPISYQRDTIGAAIATADHGARMFRNGARVGGVLKHPGKLSEEAARRLKQSWEEAHTGDNAFKTALLEEGMEWEQLGMTNADAEFLASRKFQRSEIAGIFRVPPHKIGDLERATFSNIEHQALEFVTDTLLPYLRRIEGRLRLSLLTPSERKRYFFEFLVDGLLRGDAKSRFERYQIGLQNGIYSANEVRALENMNPRDGGDAYMVPLNMSTEGDQQEEAPADDTGTE